MEIDWNAAPIINGTDKNCFFTRESFALYSVQPSFIGTLYSEPSDGGGQLQTSQRNSVRDANNASNNKKSNIAAGKKTTPEAAGPPSGTTTQTEISPKNQTANDKKPAKWMQAKMGLKVLYPRPSSMTKLEQKTYFELSERFRHLPPQNQEDMKQLSRLKELQLKVSAEQDEYMAFLEGIARQFVSDYNTVHPVVEKFVSEYLEKRRRNVYRYPRRYILHDTVPVAPSKGQLNVSLTHIDTLLEMGTVAKLILPNLAESGGSGITKVPLDYNKVSKRYPQCSSESSGSSGGEYTKTPISSDVNMDHLLTKYKVDLAMSLGAFQCLIDNYPHNISRQWELAVTVKEYDVIANGEVSKQKVVCLDSPFIPKMITPQEKNLIYYKLALKTLILHPNHDKSKADYFSRSHKQDDDCSEMVSSENLFVDATDDLSSLEVFGTDAQELNVSKSVLSVDLAMSDSDTSNSDITDLPTISTTIDSQTGDAFSVSGDIRLVSTDIPPLSPIPCLDGLVDEKPTEGEEKGECSSGGLRRSLRSRKSSADDEIGSGVKSIAFSPRRSMRLASRGKIPDSELTDSDNDGSLLIDCASPKEFNFGMKCSSDSAFQSNVPCKNRLLMPGESGDVGEVIRMQSPNKDSSSSETVARGANLDTLSPAVHGSSIQSLVKDESKEGKMAIETTLLQPFSLLPGSPKAINKSIQTLYESAAKSTSESVLNESFDTLVTRSLSDSTICDYIPQMEDVEVENPSSSVSSQTSSTGFMEGASATDGLPVEIKSIAKKRRRSTVDTCTEVKVEDAVMVPFTSVMPVAKRTRGSSKKVDVPVNKDLLNKDLSMCDLGSGDGKLTSELDGRLSKDTPGMKTEIRSSSLATPYEEIVAKASAAQTSRVHSMAPAISKSLVKDMPVPSVSSFSKSSANYQPTDVQSFLDQLLTEQTKMFDRTVRKQSPQLGICSAVQTLSLTPAATITVSSETNKPPGLLNDRAVGGPINAMGDCVQQHSKKKVAALVDAAPAKTMCENTADYVRPSVGNVAYHLWSLGNLKFILRHSHQGVYQPHRHKAPYFMHIQAKLEHQAEHGIEQLTPSEAIRSWTALQFKLRTRLLRAHINASSSELVLCENLDQNPLLLKANPSASLVSVHLLLERLIKLGVGTYLIGHMPGSQHIQIKKTTQAERGVYDLHLAYQSTETLLNQPTSSASYWLPIDPSIRLRYHIKYSRIPCTFEPKDTAMVNTTQQVNFRKNTKKKGKTNS